MTTITATVTAVYNRPDDGQVAVYHRSDELPEADKIVAYLDSNDPLAEYMSKGTVVKLEERKAKSGKIYWRTTDVISSNATATAGSANGGASKMAVQSQTQEQKLSQAKAHLELMSSLYTECHFEALAVAKAINADPDSAGLELSAGDVRSLAQGFLIELSRKYQF